MLFGDRVHRALFNNGPLTSAESVARYQEIAGELPQAIVAESARWGDMHRSTPYTKAEWQNEINNVVSFFNGRNSVFLQQLRTAGLYPTVVAPTFNQHGGQVPSGFDLSITAPAGTIWYTLDGSDPRAIGSAVSSSAIQYTGSSIPIIGGVTAKARVLSGGQWSALNVAEFVNDLSNLRFTELHYNPAAFSGVSDRQDIEFVELLNTGGQAVGLGGVQIAGFDDSPYVFPAGLTLGAGERIIVACDTAVFQSVYGSGFNLAPEGYSPRNLSNSGEQVSLLGPGGEVLQSISFGDIAPWPTAPDGNGPSLEIVDPAGNQGDPANWRASAFVGGSPGTNGVAGDYDGNGAVTVADRLQWRASFGLTVARGTGADGNRDGVVDAADYIAWRNAMVSTEIAAAAAVTESVVAESAALSAESASVAIPERDSRVSLEAIDAVVAFLSPEADSSFVSSTVLRPRSTAVTSGDLELLLSAVLPSPIRECVATSISDSGHEGSVERTDWRDVDAVFAEFQPAFLSGL